MYYLVYDYELKGTAKVDVYLNRKAYVRLMNPENYDLYRIKGLSKDVKFKGGYAPNSPYRVRIPKGHWYLVVDLGDENEKGKLEVKIKDATES